MCFYFLPPDTKSSRVPKATPLHLVSNAVVSNHDISPLLMVSRPGWAVFFLFYFPFRSAGSRPLGIQQRQTMKKRCMMSCRRSLVTRFPGSRHFPLSFPLPPCPLPCHFGPFRGGGGTHVVLLFGYHICAKAPDRGVCVLLTRGCPPLATSQV